MNAKQWYQRSTWGSNKIIRGLANPSLNRTPPLSSSSLPLPLNLSRSSSSSSAISRAIQFWCLKIVSPDIMGARVGFVVFLFVLTASWACEGRNLVSESSVMNTNEEAKRDIQPLEEVSGKEKICTLCEEFASQAVDYLSENKTQTEIIMALHLTCSQAHTFKHQCISLVDYYVPLFFLEVATVQPEEFCQKVNLCEKVVIPLQPNQDSCGVCHHAVSEVMDKLNDPETQLEIIELLLKVCSSADKYAKKCKKMVFEYGPVILVNAEQFLETTDVCTVIHACDARSSEQASLAAEVSSLSVS